MKRIHEKELASIMAMSAPDRYSVFVRRVADWQEVWSLPSSNGWRLMADENGTEIVPVWPHKQFAAACANTSLEEVAAAINLDDWLEKWLPGIMNDGRLVAVFPVPTGEGVVVTADRLRADLLSECEQYE
jgi:hypothetical protein